MENVLEMLDGLGLRLTDAPSKVFTGKHKHEALSNGQIIVAQLLNNGYLTELEVLDEAEAVSSGAVNFSNLSNSVLRGSGGILNVKNTNGKQCAMINFPEDIKDDENSLRKGSPRQPKAWVFSEAIRLLPTSLTNIDAYYMKMPSPLLHPFAITGASPSLTDFEIDSGQNIVETNDYYIGAPVWLINKQSYHVITAFAGATRDVTVSPAFVGDLAAETLYFAPTGKRDFHLTNLEAVTSDLNASLDDLIVTFAEAECWAMARELDRKRAALKKAADTIVTLNEDFKQADGIGLQGRR